MVRREAVYGCGDGLTPDVAAKLVQLTERYRAKLQMEVEDRRVMLDSLIGILSVECRRDARVTVIAEGDDEQQAADAIVAALEGR